MARGAWPVFLAVSALSGTAYLVIKLAVADLSPVVVTFVRCTVAAAVLAPLAWHAGALGALRGRGALVVAFACLEFAAPFLLVTAGSDRIASSLAGVLMAAGPLLVALLALWLDRTQRVRGARLAGLVVGMLGVVLLLGVEVSASADEALGALLVLLASCSFAAGSLVLGRHLADAPPLGLVGVALGVSAAVLAVPVALALPASAPAPGSAVATAVLGPYTALNYSLFVVLVHRAGAGRAAVTAYVAPAVAVALGVALLGEPLHAVLVAGLLLVVAGSWLSTGGRLPPGPAAWRSRATGAGTTPRRVTDGRQGPALCDDRLSSHAAHG